MALTEMNYVEGGGAESYYGYISPTVGEWQDLAPFNSNKMTIWFNYTTGPYVAYIDYTDENAPSIIGWSAPNYWGVDGIDITTAWNNQYIRYYNGKIQINPIAGFGSYIRVFTFH